jgi:hypothetical protein
MGMPSDLVFQAVRRVSKDISRALNAEAIEHAHSRGWINDWERDFSFDTMRKRVLSEKQKSRRQQINQMVMRQINRNRQTGQQDAGGCRR